MFEQSSSEIPSSIWASMNSWFTPAVFFVLLNLMIGTIAITSTFANNNKKQNQNQNEVHNHLHHHHNQPKVAASSSSSQPSSVLQRLKSTSFYPYFRSQDPQLSSIYKPTPDTDTLFNPEQAHENHDYFFQENVQASQAHKQGPSETETHSIPGPKDSSLDDSGPAQDDPPPPSMDEVYSQLAGVHFSRTKSDTEPSSGEFPAKLPAKMKKSASLKSAFGRLEAAEEKEAKALEARRPATVREKGSAKATDGDEGVDARADDFINRFKQQLKLQRLDSILRYRDVIGRGSGK